MVEVNGRDDTEQRTLDNIGRIQNTAQPDLDNGQISRRFRHGQKTRCRRAFKHGGLAARCGHGLFDAIKDAVQMFVGNQRARQTDALVETHQMRRGIGMHLQTRRLGNGADQGNGRSLAVGPRHMDDRRQSVLRMAQCRAKSLHTSQ